MTASIPETGVLIPQQIAEVKSSVYQRQVNINRRQRELDTLNELEQARLAVEAYENPRKNP
ncbi:hypothetical protein ACTNDN_19475 [Niallia sp. HCP3S3_B10]|uniref:hypothetical protein n=1 Tax=Niallia sp. HCP3S3_B10 TaxID=3438944 RepID=UPI003F89303D